MLNYIVIGSGWRSLFYVRIAQAYPEYFHISALLCRTEEKAERIRLRYGIHTTTSIEECESLSPDLIIVAVNKASICQVTQEWAMKGYPVLCETPAALTLEELNRLWNLSRQGARIQVAEQYLRYPLFAASLEAVKQGFLGDPYAVSLSAVHDYHGASLIRSFLGVGAAEPMKVWGKRYTFPVMETDSRYGPIMDGSVKDRDRVRITFEFESGKVGFYDFSGVQYHSKIRSRHLNVQGVNGELDDFTLRYTDDRFLPVKEEMEIYRDGEGIRQVALGERILYQNPFSGLTGACLMSQDETAIASLLLDLEKWLKEPQNYGEAYPLASALQDAYTLILMNQALEHPGQVINSAPQSWQLI